MLVGDIIMEVRELITDVPQQTLAAPTLTTIVPTNIGGYTGPTIPPGTYYFVLTETNPWGESLGSAEFGPVTISLPNNLVSVTAWTASGLNTGIKLYLGTSPGGENVNTGVLPFTGGAAFTTGTFTSSGAPPVTRSTAFLPDVDGGAFSAGSLFRWLSQGLTECSRIAGGIMDYTGVGTVEGQPLYIIPGEWQSLSDVWYDGYPVSQIGRNTMFRRNTVQSSILGAVTVSVRDNRVILECWPQPARTAAVTTTTANVGLTDTTINVASTAGFVLPFGFAQVGSEVMSYASVNGTQLIGCVRGLSGGISYISTTGTQVNELNFFFNGKRIFTTGYAPGSSLTTIPVPAGWDELLVNFMLSKAKQAEQDFQEAARLRKSFDEQIVGWARTNRQLAGPRQVSLRDEEFSIANPHPFGGTVIP